MLILVDASDTHVDTCREDQRDLYFNVYETIYRAVRALTRVSPRSARFLSFSCLLLIVSFPPASDPSSDDDARRMNMGYITEFHNLNAAYRGI